MPSISIPAAVIGASVVGAGSSLISANKTAGAAKDTAAANNDLTRAIYNENKDLLTPYVSTGAAANRAQADLLGLGRESASDPLSGGLDASGGQAGTAGGPPVNADWATYLQQNPDVQSYYDERKGDLGAHGIRSAEQWAQIHYEANGKQEGRALPTSGSSSPALRNFADTIGTGSEIKAISDAIGTDYQGYLDKSGVGTSIDQLDKGVGSSLNDYLDRSGVATGETAADQFLGLDKGTGETGYLTNAGVKPSNDAIERFLGIGAGGMADFLNSTGYQFNLDSGSKAVERSMAARGLATSGASAKALTDYGQEVGKTYGAAYLNALGDYSRLREGQGVDYSNLLGQRTARREGLNTDYLGKVAGLGQLKASTVSDFAGLQAGLADLNRNNFATYWGATGDLANRGATAGSALAGVGTNYATSVSANNNNALAARAGANTAAANSINGLAGNALGAYTYGQGLAGWGGASVIPNSGGSTWKGLI